MKLGNISKGVHLSIKKECLEKKILSPSPSTALKIFVVSINPPNKNYLLLIITLLKETSKGNQYNLNQITISLQYYTSDVQTQFAADLY